MEKLTRVERFQAGIKRYGYDSEFRKAIDYIVNNEPINVVELDMCFEKFGV